MFKKPKGPTTALVELRELVRQREKWPPMNTDKALTNGYRLYELVKWLDDHLSHGGTPPEQWFGERFDG